MNLSSFQSSTYYLLAKKIIFEFLLEKILFIPFLKFLLQYQYVLVVISYKLLWFVKITDENPKMWKLKNIRLHQNARSTYKS